MMIARLSLAKPLPSPTPSLRSPATISRLITGQAL
jgi:hypothetical protein